MPITCGASIEVGRVKANNAKANRALKMIAIPPSKGIGWLCSFRDVGASTKPLQIANRLTNGVLTRVKARAIRKMKIKIRNFDSLCRT